MKISNKRTLGMLSKSQITEHIGMSVYKEWNYILYHAIFCASNQKEDLRYNRFTSFNHEVTTGKMAKWVMLLMHMGNSIFHSFNGAHLLSTQLQWTLLLHTKQTKGTET